MKEQECEISGALLREWRASGVISAEETAFKIGDLYVAENVLTRSRRVISPEMRESIANKRVLKG